MSSIKSFINQPKHLEWKFIFEMYSEVLIAKAAKKTKTGASKQLVSLDKWYVIM